MSSGFQSYPSPFRLATAPHVKADTRIAQPGDHFRVSRGLYSHHAIYVGNGWLIEFGSGFLGGVVAYVDWQTFSGGSNVELVGCGGWVAAERAKCRLGMGGFNLISRNCEHFANWCVTGEWESGQVTVVAVAALSALFLALVTKKAPRFA